MESEPEITEAKKQLAVQLRTIINADSTKSRLENLQKELNEYKNSPTGEKKQVYSEYRQVIDLMLLEIKNELTRREQSQKDQQKSPQHDKKNLSPTTKKSTIPPVVIIASISAILIAFLICLVA